MSEDAPGTYASESDKRFIRNYQFVGYLGAELHGKALSAIEVGTNSNVAIHFIKDKQVEEKKRMLVQYLIGHRAFEHVLYVKNLRNMNAFVTEHSTWETAEAFMKRSHPLGPQCIYRIYVQMLDALAHLHERGISHNSVRPDTVLIAPSRLVKLSDLSHARFYDQQKEENCERGDILALGRALVYLAAKSRQASGPVLASIVQHMGSMPSLESSRISAALEYIFRSNGPLHFSVLQSINGALPSHETWYPQPVPFLDALVVDVLASLGVDTEQLTAHVNSPAKKEYHMYRLCQARIAAELDPAAKGMGSALGTESSYMLLCNTIERQKELLSRRYMLYMGRLVRTGSFSQWLCCKNVTVDRIVVDMVMPVSSKLRHSQRNDFQLHELTQRSVRAVSKSAELELQIIGRANHGCRLKTPRSGKLIFRRCSGKKHDFVQLVISILDGMHISTDT